MKNIYLFRPEHIPERPRFPAVDAHNHLWGNWAGVEGVRAVCDACGVVSYCDLTANASLSWVQGGYELGAGDFAEFLRNAAGRYPGRFYGFTMSAFAAPTSQPLFEDCEEFVDRCARTLREHVAAGARGLKLIKEMGLAHTDAEGNLLRLDDPRFAPIWRTAAELNVPVLMHQSDPYGFFQPVTPENEHYDSLQKYPSWQFWDRTKYPSKEELLQRRDRLVAAHPETTFILPHMANFAENLDYVAGLLEKHPNVWIDFSARLDECGRQPYRFREFLVRYQDRVLFGTDMPASEPMYRCYFRFLETRDEFFVPPDYDGTFGRYRWCIYGIGLEEAVLEKLYFRNALRAIPHLGEDLETNNLL